MSAGLLDLEVEQGATFQQSFKLADKNGNAVNLSEYTMSGQIRQAFTGSLVANFGISVTDGLGGEFKVVLAATQSEAMDARQKYHYDIERRINADVFRVLQGSFVLSPEVTK